MERYRNLGGDSNVYGFEISDGAISVQFNDGFIYHYTNLSAGAANIAEMRSLARQGHGLNSFINRVVRKLYASKTR